MGFTVPCVLGVTVSLATATVLVSVLAAQDRTGRQDEWRHYASDSASTKYSALSQIDRENFKNLQTAWTWQSPEDAIVKENPSVKTWAWEGTPVMVDGVLYVSTSLSQVAAIDAASGKTRWVYDPGTWKGGYPPNHGFVHRGVAFWASGDDQRILYGTGDAYLICLNAKTGQPVTAFGSDGRVDLTQGLRRPVNRQLYGVSSPPVICRDTIVVGSTILDFPLEKEMPPGDVRGFDVRTGSLRWTFNSVAQEGEFGSETWLDGSWKPTGNANVWTMMSADEELGYVYLPFGTPQNDYYGGERPGDGLFGEALVCVDVRTGKRIWHFQMVRHGVWDYDLPAAPNLVDIRVNGRKIKAVAQVSKQGFCYVLNRVTGKPLWPIEDRPVPQSTIPGERTSATQPFPTRPAPFDRQGFTKDDLIDFTPELREKGLKVLEKYHYGPLFSPPSEGKPTISMPGVAGGANWAGAAFDPETSTLFVPSITLPFAVGVGKSPLPHTKYVGGFGLVEGVDGLPLHKPPYARITAIDLNTGDHRWMTPLGDGPRDHPALKGLNLPPLGRPARGLVLLTKTLLVVGQEGETKRYSASPKGFAAVAEFGIVDPKLVAFDKSTGKQVGEVALPRNATGAPITYRVNGKQYIVVPTGGANMPAELIALSLP